MNNLLSFVAILHLGRQIFYLIFLLKLYLNPFYDLRKPSVECYPMPDALNPCEDVMGYQWLRISVWVVVALAVVGNVAVLTVNLSIR